MSAAMFANYRVLEVRLDPGLSLPELSAVDLDSLPVDLFTLQMRI